MILAVYIWDYHFGKLFLQCTQVRRRAFLAPPVPKRKEGVVEMPENVDQGNKVFKLVRKGFGGVFGDRRGVDSRLEREWSSALQSVAPTRNKMLV